MAAEKVLSFSKNNNDNDSGTNILRSIFFFEFLGEKWHVTLFSTCEDCQMIYEERSTQYLFSINKYSKHATFPPFPFPPSLSEIQKRLK